VPLDEREYVLADVADDLRDKMEAAAEEQASYDVGTPGAKQAAQEGQRQQQYRAGVLWALGWPGHDDREGSGWGTDTITFGALKNGERRMIADLAEEKGLARGDLYVAAGTVAAPYLEHDPHNTRPEDVVDTALAVADLHPHFADWAESAISDLGGMGAEGNAYRKLVQAKRTSQTSPN
jgi:hypothetical protein